GWDRRGVWILRSGFPGQSACVFSLRRSRRNIRERQKLRRCAFGLERDPGEISPSARARGSAPAQGAHSWSATKPEGNERYVSSALKRISEKPGRVDGAYYIGKAAFEMKDYKTALASLNTARQLD